LRERPEVPDHFELVLDAFLFLSPSRPAGFAVGAIPLSEILAFADAHPLGIPRFEFVRIIRLIDLAFLAEHHAQKAKPKDGPETHADR
jgi:hypothetical protein